jgi:phosphoglycolate phosphatase
LNPIKRISVVIFDCDGVMFDSRQANVNYYNQVLSHFSLPPMTEEEADYVHMHTANESIEHIFRGTSHAEQAQSYRLEIDYSPFIKNMIIEPGLKELLGILRPEYGLAVATNRGDTIEKVLEYYGLTALFDIVVSSLDVQKPKPDPEAIYKIINFFRIRPEQAMYIGDSLVDWQTATAAGANFVAYKNEGLKTQLKVNNLLDLLELLITPNKIELF